MPTDDILLRMQGIRKEFFGNVVLQDVNITLGKGKILGLVGENGAGKSTLMKILFGLKEIHETGGYDGKIILEGKEVRFMSPFEALDAGIGMVHQEFMLLPGFSATENIMLNREIMKPNFFVEVFGERMSNLDFTTMENRAERAIQRIGVDLDKSMLVSEMPVGHKQFTEIAREIDRQATKILVLDEPTAVLTETEAAVMLEVARKLADEGLSIIFITHRLKEIMNICDDIVVLRDGHLVKECPITDTDPDKITEWMVGRDLSDATVPKSERIETSASDIMLKVEHLWVDMPGEHVRNVNFEVLRGEIFGIGGLAGQGKLGIANGIMGLFAAGGDVTVNGRKVELNNPRKALEMKMAFVSEDRRGVGLLLDEPIDWNIAFSVMQSQELYIKRFLGGLIKWRDDRAIAKLAREYIQLLEIKCVSERQIARQLSGGNQQKVCLAKAFALNPELLFVSEPTRGIDVGAKKVVLDTLRDYNHRFGTTIVIASSELEELRSISDRIAIVSEGEIAGILPPTAPVKEFGALMLEA
ncbi:MAG TPA: sugar ABC transporter ATP-binding protein [Thermotogota bacterium]|nr:sugar ABC transporter ATP-binding protein [Thermotogota bacterium]HRW92083.1 sugar ABC transporter ATP-binding protein [Thermotogota bacterium]